MLQALKRAIIIDKTNPNLHQCIIDFVLKGKVGIITRITNKLLFLILL